MNTNVCTHLKFKLLAGVALAAPALSVHATQVAPYFYTWAFGGSGYAANSLAQAKAAGVNLSFGGADGSFLEDDCSASGLYNIINNLISTYNIRNLDFDAEGDEVDGTGAANTRNAVLEQLQAAYLNLYVSFTVPVDTDGLPGDVATLIQNAKNAGVNISIVNIMTMDYGPSGRAEGSVAIESANGTFNQLHSIYPSLSSAQIWGMIGITPMIGLNDGSTSNNPAEQFTAADAAPVTQFAQTNGIGLLSYWALNRDQPGAINNENDLDLYDGLGTSKFEYYNIFASTPVVNGSFPAGTYTITNDFSGLCVDDTNWSTTAIDLQQWSCSGDSNQSFRFYPIGSSTPVSVQ